MQLTRLGPYEIDKPLGKGGMGSVYAATDTHTGQRVAIKALTPHLAVAEGFRERFEAEIESLKTLRHDGIVRLYGYGEQDGVLFYSMELVDGVSLEDELRAGRRFNWREVTNIAIQLSLALKHAHDHGIVHRDIKPANILLYNDDRVKLADFGIARLFGTTSLTTAGGVLGTADYMSPEQADGRPVTARCDQYSLGGVMYALLAGRPPFHAKNLPQMLQLQRFAQPEPVRRFAPDTPEQLERVIMQLLAKSPADRFPNTQVLARHLQAMVMALSRPAADDFALAGDPPGGSASDAVVEPALASEATQAEIDLASRPDPRPAGGNARIPSKVTSSQDAATLAAEEALLPKSATSPPVSLIGPSADGATPTAFERPSRFTTVEEEEARRGAHGKRSWLMVAAQLAALAAVLVGMGALAMHLSRPPSADELFETISTQVEKDEDGSLNSVESEVNEFLALYPNDRRAGELKRYQERIELDKLERKLQREVRGNGTTDSSLLPVEQLYLQATAQAQFAPDNATRMLQSLVDLYSANVSASEEDATGATTAAESVQDAAARTSAIVQLAQRRIAALQADLVAQRERNLVVLRERLDTAKQLSATEPQQATAMYRAIVDLHEHDDWAKEVVNEARGQLAEPGDKK